jgi:CheY-like chemotaxis protein
LDLDQVIAGTMNLLDRLIGEHIDLRFSARGGIKTVHADPGQVEQIIMNLCVNARDAMPGGGTIRIDSETVTFEAVDLERNPWAREGAFALMSIADDGTGIPDEHLDRIFEPFYTTKGVGQGTGLGLATVYAVVRRHDGLIRVESRPGVGTTFRIYLPLLDRETVPVGDPAPESDARGGRETVLVAEDDTMVRRWVRGVLAGAGYRVLEAADGREALDLFRRYAREIDLALLDVVMPRLNGREVHREIRNTRPHVPVIFTSGYSYDILKSHQLAEREFVVLQKPYDPGQILARVREALDASSGGTTAGPSPDGKTGPS